MEYNLDTDTLEQEQDNIETKTEYKELKLVVDYDLNLSNVETYKYKDNDEEGETKEEKTTEFSQGEYITVKFNSTNKTTCVLKKAIINGKTYELSQDKNIYTAVIDSFDSVGEHNIAIEKVILSNGKVIDVSSLEENEEVTIKVIKNTPTIARFRANENRSENNMNAHIYVKDINKTISNIIVKLYDDEENEIESKNLTQSLTEENLVKAAWKNFELI